jgi:hypothetical protein
MLEGLFFGDFPEAATGYFSASHDSPVGSVRSTPGTMVTVPRMAPKRSMLLRALMAASVGCSCAASKRDLASILSCRAANRGLRRELVFFDIRLLPALPALSVCL